MLVIKHIEVSGNEFIYTCKATAYIKEESSTTELQLFNVDLPNGGAFYEGFGRISSGSVYIMNNSGATVGKYVF